MVDTHVMRVIAQFEAKTSQARAALNTFKKQADTARKSLGPLQKKLKTQQTGLNNLRNQLDYEKQILDSHKDISKETKAQTKIGFKERLRGAQQEIQKTKERITQQKKVVSEAERGASRQKRVINDLNKKREREISSINKKAKTEADTLSKSISSRRKQISSMDALSNKHAEIRRVMKATGLGANDSARAMSNLGFTFNKSGQAVDSLGNRMKLTNKRIMDMRASTRKFNMSMLSLMFASMALSRAIGGFLRSAIKSYNKATGENSEFRKATSRLTAAWEFFKYSLVDALAQSEMFKNLVGFVVNLINKLNKIPQQTKAVIALGIGFLFVATMILMVVGQAGLAQNAFQSMGNSMRGAKKALGLSSWLAFAAVIALIITLVIGAVKGFKLFKKAREDAEKPDGVISLAGAFKFLGVVFKNVLHFLGVGFSVIFALLESLFTYFQIGLKAILTGAQIVALSLQLAFRKAINWIIDKVIGMAKKIVSVWNRIRGVFGKDPINVDFSRLEDFRKDVDSTKDKINNLKNELKDYTNESNKYLKDLWVGLAEETPSFKELSGDKKTNDVLNMATPNANELMKGASQNNEAMMRNLTSNQGKNVTSNVTDNRQVNVTVNASPDMNMDELADKIMERQEDELSLGIGSTNE